MSGSIEPVSPSPQCYLLTDEGVGGALKERPGDFIVEELPAYRPMGEGEHLYLRIEKIGVSHGELISCLCRHFGVTGKQIGYAGMKDKIGITRQMVSIHLLKDPSSLDLPHERIRVLEAKRHRNKLRRGHLKGNRFMVRIRDLEADRAPEVLDRLRKLQRVGVPDYFGPQRFGYRNNNHILGAAFLRRDWTGLLAELLGAGGSWFPEYQRDRRELFEQGRLADAAEQWTVADRAELLAAQALRDGRGEKAACLAVGRPALGFWVTASVSAIFNKVVDQRIGDGLMARLIEGDLAFKHDSRAVFRVTKDELVGDELDRRVADFEVSPSGPLWGKNMTRAEAGVGQREAEAVEAAGLSIDLLTDPRRAPNGGRRPLREPVRNVEVDSGTDGHGPYVKACFDLTRGTYATVVMREVMKVDEAALTGVKRD